MFRMLFTYDNPLTLSKIMYIMYDSRYCAFRRLTDEY